VDFKIRYSKPALIELDSVVAWSLQNHLETTERFTTALMNYVDLLKSLPYLGISIRGYPGIRRILHSPLHVYYRVDEEQSAVEILHFWHVKRKTPRL
jgi:plasmid stabilization system protein ParE